MELALLFFLTLLNGAFAMSEMALAASRKARLQVMAETGDVGAQTAIELHDNPTRFLSTVQVGITSISVLNGIVGDAAFSEPLAHWLHGMLPMISPRACAIAATALVVMIITFLTIIFGELVPKRIGQIHPEETAAWIAKPLDWLSRSTRPFVRLLSFITDTVLTLLGVREHSGRAMTEEEIEASLEEGVDAGVIEEHEHQMVRNVFRLDERPVGSMMVPRTEIIWLDADSSREQVLHAIAEHGHSHYPVCRGGLQDVIGVITAQMLLKRVAADATFSLHGNLVSPDFVPETLSGMELLEHFRRASVHIVFVVDEYGEVQGMVTLRDLLEAITGEFIDQTADDAWAVQRQDGSWLIDGLMPAQELKDRLDLKALPDEEHARYNTAGGMVVSLLGQLPRTADAANWEGWRFEVVDMDGRRVDKILASPLPASH